MKPAVRLFLALVLVFGIVSAEAATLKSGRARVSGQKYVSLSDWARVNRFAVRWLNSGRYLQLSNRLARVVFTADPRQDRTKAWINGVEVSLNFPVVYQNRIASIAQLDLDQTLSPILSPPKQPGGIKIKTICLDPGHGGDDPGFQIGSNQEKKYTLLLAQEVRDQLKSAGLNVVLTRSSDYRVPRKMRPELARKRSADLFVSLHFNATETARSQVEGVEVYCLTPAGAYSTNARGEGNTRWVTGNRNDEKNMFLAYQMQKSIVGTLGGEDRGVKRARFDVLHDATMPAVLIEGGFMSHPTEGKKIFDPAYRQRMARAIADGILAYKKAVKG